ncbi:hypothetical protein [Kitasatospora sp. NPDC088779]|uniref:hypothetical protein n=1 Tax=Kitasatospora sp. NPDC088779 TaxID=3154964 RepID=UPI003432CA81
MCEPGEPPPCRRCGSLEYYSAGLCQTCHHFAPDRATSCRDCLAWGLGYRRRAGLCLGCVTWRKGHPEHGRCSLCRLELHLRDGACRLCWRQLWLTGRPRKDVAPDELAAANRHGQQLALGGLEKSLRRHLPRQRPSFKDARCARQKAQATRPVPVIPPVRARALLLFNMPRDLAAGARAGLPEPADEDLVEAVDAFARDYGRRHGWPTDRHHAAAFTLRRGLRILLATQDVPGAPIKASEAARLNDIRLPFGPVLDVLAAAGLLDDDRVPAIVPWFERKTAGLPDPMAEELRTWFDIARLGHATAPRSRPRPEQTIRLLLYGALPVLQSWAASSDSLRSISRQDVKVALAPYEGDRAHSVLQGLRAVFRTLKAHKVVFTDPTSRISLGTPASEPPLPLALDPLLAAVHSPDPTRAALGSLLAFHALRPAQLRALLVTDLADGRLRVGDGRVILLAAEVRRRLHAYLAERARRWPSTANPHLFVSQFTALRTRQVTGTWVNQTLGLSAQAIREDRILDEALAAAGDPRRLCDLFGLTVDGAQRYTSALGHTDLNESPS